jgi:heat shock protein HslJ
MILARPRTVLLLATLLVCASAPQAQTSNLTGTSWRLVQFQAADDFNIPADDKDRYTLFFAPDHRLAVRIDCNRGSGTWTSSAPGELRIDSLAITRAMCASTPLNKRLPRDFDYVRSYTLKNGHLFLSLQADGGIYEFEPADSASSDASQTSAPIEHTTWQLTQLGDKNITPDPQHGPHITLNPEQHRVTGSAGCNRLTGGYMLEGNRLKFHQIATTMMACTEGMDTERAFLDALNKTDSWKITGNKLELFNAVGKPLASFQAGQ